MYGALLGDMIGAPYEFDRGNKSKEFPLFCENSRFTDDSVMTIAVAEALLDSRFLDDDSIRAALIKSMRKWAKSILMPATAGSSSVGSGRKIQSPTAAAATARPCAFPRQAGCSIRSKRRGKRPD